MSTLDLTPPHPVEQSADLMRYLHEQFTVLQRNYARVVGAVQVDTPATTTSGSYVDLAGFVLSIVNETESRGFVQIAVSAVKNTAGTGTIAIAVDGVTVTTTEVTVTTTTAYIIRMALVALTVGDHVITLQAKSSDANSVAVSGLLVGQSFE